MSTKKITALTELSAAPAATDMMPIVDVSDTTDASSGTTKKITATNIAKGVGIGAGNTTTEPVKIDTSNGRLGVGTTTPLLPFMVTGSSSSPATSGSTPNGIMAISNTNTYNTLYGGAYTGSPYAFWLQAANRSDLSTSMAIAVNPLGGNVGIGTTSPGVKLHISDDDNNTSLTSSNSRSIELQDTSEHNNALSQLAFSTSNGYLSASMGSRATTNVAGASVRSDIFFANRDSDSGFTEKMVIKSGGNVGIGTDSPAAILETSDSVNGEFVGLQISNSRTAVDGDTGDQASIHFKFKDEGSTLRSAGKIVSQKIDDYYGSTAVQDSAFDFCTALNGTDTFAMRIDQAGNVLLGGTSTPTSSVGNLCLFNGTAPAASVTNGVVLYAQDVSTSELKVRDEAGNVSTLSPHNFELLGDRSEEMAWSYSSKNVFVGKEIAVDMTKVIRALEKLTGEEYIKIKDIAGSEKLDWEEEEQRKEAEQKKLIDAYKKRKAELEAYPTKSSTKAEIKAFLDKKGISYSEDIQKTEEIEKDIMEIVEVKKGDKWIQKKTTKTIKTSKEVFEEVDVYDEEGKVKVGKKKIPVMVKSPELTKDKLLELVPKKPEFTEEEPTAYTKKSKPKWVK